jgi:hypothetical protein
MSRLPTTLAEQDDHFTSPKKKSQKSQKSHKSQKIKKIKKIKKKS